MFDVGNMIKEGISYILDNILAKLFYVIEKVICKAVGYMQQLFDVFTGTAMVTYDNSDSYLINVFFGNKAVAGIYWGMAAIGIVLSFVFALTAVVRKMFDLDDKAKHTFGQILRGLLKSILIILSLNVAMTVVITSTNVLMKSVTDIFDKNVQLTEGNPHIDFTNEQFAAMSRIFNTVGNYSLNPSYLSRYNLNTCYNDIRGDLKYLSDTGMFKYDYEEPDKAGGKAETTWQSVLQELALAADFNKEVPVDNYNEGIANALSNCMNILKTNSGFHALESFDRKNTYNRNNLALDRVLFVIGTMGIGNTAAARNEAFNKNPDLYDNLRKPYVLGTKDAFDIDQVNKDFSLSPSKMNYLVIYLAGTMILGVMALIILNCIVRIFNLLFMYLIAPPIIAVSPLDDGGKFRQWMTAFIVQVFSIFATVISMRLYLIFVPVIMSPNLHLSDNTFLDTLGKVLIIVAAAQAILKANGILTGILADQAGMQSIYAGDMTDYARRSTVGKAALAVKDYVDSLPVKPLSALWDKVTGKGGAGGSSGGGGSNTELPNNKSQDSNEGVNTDNNKNDGNGIDNDIDNNGVKGKTDKNENDLPGNKNNNDDGSKKSGKGNKGGSNANKLPPPNRNQGHDLSKEDKDKRIENFFGKKGLDSVKKPGSANQVHNNKDNGDPENDMWSFMGADPADKVSHGEDDFNIGDMFGNDIGFKDYNDIPMNEHNAQMNNNAADESHNIPEMQHDEEKELQGDDLNDFINSAPLGGKNLISGNIDNAEINPMPEMERDMNGIMDNPHDFSMDDLMKNESFGGENLISAFDDDEKAQMPDNQHEAAGDNIINNGNENDGKKAVNNADAHDNSINNVKNERKNNPKPRNMKELFSRPKNNPENKNRGGAGRRNGQIPDIPKPERHNNQNVSDESIRKMFGNKAANDLRNERLRKKGGGRAVNENGKLNTDLRSFLGEDKPKKEGNKVPQKTDGNNNLPPNREEHP